MTPIQELIDLVFQERSMVDKWELLGWLKEEGLQKEKAFALDCFEAGKKLEDSAWMDTLGALPEKQPDFDDFYKQFEQ